MKAEILATGDEIRTGTVLDTNSAYIARRLEASGVEVTRQSCVGDDIHELVSILTEIGRRTQIAIITGGLGPTPDDISALSAARAAGVELVMNDAALQSVERFFNKRRRRYSESNKKQALLPAGAVCIQNPVGTAPGFVLNIQHCRCFFLPGVPEEMRHMLKESVLPMIDELRGGSPTISLVKNITTFGLTESATAERISGFDRRFPEIKLGMRVVFPEIHLKLYARGMNLGKLNMKVQDAVDWIRKKLNDKTLSTDGDTMAEVVGRLLRESGTTVGAAESCTGGLISHLLTGVAGSSDYFLFSGVTYSNQSKTAVLGVSSDTIENYGAVHEETAGEMAEGARRICDARYGISTTGIAGPAGGTKEKPVGTVCIGLAGPGGTFSKRFCFPFENRSMNKRIFAFTALDLLRKRLIRIQS